MQDQTAYNNLLNDLKIAIATAKDGIAKRLPNSLQMAMPHFTKFTEEYHKFVPFTLRLRLGMLPLGLRQTPPETPNDNIESDDLNSFKSLLSETQNLNLQISKLIIHFF